MRSSSGPGIVSSMLAVVMKTTRRQIEGHTQIVVAERAVLRRVQHLEQRRGRIALDAAAELVDLVQHHDAVPRRPPCAVAWMMLPGKAPI